MTFKENNSVSPSGYLWYLLYFGSVLVYLLFLHILGDNFVDAPVVAFLPLSVLVLSILVEYNFPYNHDWLKIDLGSINNILFAISTNYGDALGRSLGFSLSVKLGNWITPGLADSYWPKHMPVFIQVILGLLLYDFVYYWYHRLGHHMKILWRFHRLHHSSDKLTTIAGFRFNIVDIFLELLLITLVVQIAGVPDKIFLIMVGFMTPATTLSHANFESNVPDWLGWVVINPDNHRIHHANQSLFYNKNFGGFTLFWDVVFGTYVSAKNVKVSKVGVEGHTTSKWIWAQFFDFLKR